MIIISLGRMDRKVESVCGVLSASHLGMQH